MNTRIFIAAAAMSLVTSIASAQMGSYGGKTQSQAPPSSSGDKAQPMTKTTTKTTYPVGVKGYLDQQMEGAKDKKFHVSLNGKDLALTPVKIHDEKKTSGNKSSAAAEMKGPDGKIYQINFVLSGGQVTGASIGK